MALQSTRELSKDQLLGYFQACPAQWSKTFRYPSFLTHVFAFTADHAQFRLIVTLADSKMKLLVNESVWPTQVGLAGPRTVAESKTRAATCCETHSSLADGGPEGRLEVVVIEFASGVEFLP